jgi:hypothetical protein
MSNKKSKKKHKKVNKKNSNQVTPKQSIKTTKTPAKPIKQPVKNSAPTLKESSSDNRKYLIFIILAILGALIIAVLVLANQTNTAKNDATNTGQDELLKVQTAKPESLQPNGTDSTNPQQSLPLPQGDSRAVNEIQPQTPVNPEQQEQIQQ